MTLPTWLQKLGTFASSDPLLERLCLASLELAILALGILLIARVARLRSPRVAAFLWLIVLIKPIVSLAVGSPYPVVVLDSAGDNSTAPQPWEEQALAATGDARPSRGASSTARLSSLAATEAARTLHLNSEKPARSDAKAVSDDARTLPLSQSWSGARWVVAAWLAGAAVFLGLNLWNRARLYRIKRAARPLSPFGLSRCRRIGAALGLERVPQVLVTDALGSPALCGCARPAILIPSWLEAEVTSAEFEWAIRHELMHWKWLDPWPIFIKECACVLFFFHPAAWLAAKELVQSLELACDRALVRSAAEAARYAEQLCRFLEKIRQRRQMAVANGLFATRTQIGQRIAALLDSSWRNIPQMTAGSVLGVGLFAAATLSFGAAAGRNASNDSLRRAEALVLLQSAGLDQIPAESPLGKVWALPETQEFSKQIAGKLANAFSHGFRVRPARPHASCASLLAPIFADLLRFQFRLEMHSESRGGHSGMLAARLPQDRAALWKENLERLVEGWEWSASDGQLALSFEVIDGWFVAALVPQASPLRDLRIVQRILNDGRPMDMAEEELLTVEAGLAVLSRFISGRDSDAPRLALTVKTRDDHLRTEGRLRFPRPVLDQLEPWQIPVHIIRDPNGLLHSFTALRGFEAWLKKWPKIDQLKIGTVPNQLFLWGDGHVPFQMFAAVPMPGATNVVNHWAAQQAPELNEHLRRNALGELRHLAEEARVIWQGLPLVVPHLRPATDSRSEFLIAGLFPVEERRAEPPPEALLAQLAGPRELVYYDWEYSPERLRQWRSILSLIPILSSAGAWAPQSPVVRWTQALESKLGNTITEIEARGPQELVLTRRSQTGLTALELILLAWWMESPSFPKFELDLHPHSTVARER